MKTGPRKPICVQFRCSCDVQLRESCEFLGMRVTVGPCTLRAETFEFAIVGIEQAVSAMKCALLHPMYTRILASTPYPGIAGPSSSVACQVGNAACGHREADVMTNEFASDSGVV